MRDGGPLPARSLCPQITTGVSAPPGPHEDRHIRPMARFRCGSTTFQHEARRDRGIGGGARPPPASSSPTGWPANVVRRDHPNVPSNSGRVVKLIPLFSPSLFPGVLFPGRSRTPHQPRHDGVAPEMTPSRTRVRWCTDDCSPRSAPTDNRQHRSFPGPWARRGRRRLNPVSTAGRQPHQNHPPR